MARAMTAGELSKIRSDNQHTRLYLAVLEPATVMTAQVNGAPSDNDQVAQLTIDNASFSGGYSTALKDMLVYVGTGSGNYDKGMVRLRGALSGTPTTMKVGEISEIDWSDDDWLTVVDEFNIFPKHLRLTGSTTYMDWDIDFGDPTHNPHAYPGPVPVLGPSLVPVWLSGATVDVPFDAGDSWALDGGAVTYAWSAPGASGTSGMSTATPTITYNATGTYRVSCVVTRDYGGGVTVDTTGYRYVRVFDDNDTPIEDFVLDSCSGSWGGGGWSFRVTLHDDADRSQVRDRALVCLFAKDWYGGTEGSIGPISDRENIVAIGWIDGESINMDPEEGTVGFEVKGPWHWLSQIHGFPAGLEDTDTTPATWLDFQGLTVDAGVWQILYWRTSALKIIDFYASNDTRLMTLFNASPGTLWSQITADTQQAIFAQACCDRFGRLFVQVDPQMVESSDRSSWPVVHTLQQQDLSRPVNIPRVTVPSVGLVDLSGIYWDGSDATPLFSLAPGHVPKWHGPSIERREYLALSGQNQANILAGLFMEWRNNMYPKLQLPLAANHRMIDVVPYQRLELTLSSGDTARGIAWTKNLVPRQVSFSHDTQSGQLLTEVEAEAEVSEGLGIVGDPPPEVPTPGAPDDPLPGFTPEEDPPVVDVEMAIVGTTGGINPSPSYPLAGAGVVYCSDIDAASPAWTQVNGGFPFLPAISDLVVDPNARYKACCIAFTSGTDPSDSRSEVWTNSDWTEGNSWSQSLDESTAISLLEADADIPSDVEFCEFTGLWSFDVSGTTYLYVGVKYESDTETPENASGLDYNEFTRFLRSTNWGSSWAVCDRPVGYASLGHESYSMGVESPLEMSDSNDVYGIGDLGFWGNRLYCAAQAPVRAANYRRDNLTRSENLGLAWPSDMTNATFPQHGNATTQDSIGNGLSLAESSTGLVVGGWTESGTPNTINVMYTADGTYSSMVSLYSITESEFETSGDRLATVRRALAVSATDYCWALLWNAGSAETKILKGADGAALSVNTTISGHNFCVVNAHPTDGDRIVIGRSYQDGDAAGGTDTDFIIRQTTDSGGSWSSLGGATLYALGAKAITSIEFMPPTD